VYEAIEQHRRGVQRADYRQFVLGLNNGKLKAEPTHEARAEGACTLCLARRRKSLRSRIKTENFHFFAHNSTNNQKKFLTLRKVFSFGKRLERNKL
jgi:hypothetical protein